MKKRKSKVWPFLILLVLIGIVFGILHFFKGYFEKKIEKPVAEIIEKDKNVSFTLAGNVLINSNMWQDTKKDDDYSFDGIFEETNNIMKKSDVNFYFQQSIVGGSLLGASMYYKYNSPESLVTSLSKLGFNIASLASYHAYDKGIDGIKNTIETFDESKIKYSGISTTNDRKSNNIIVKNGVSIGLLSYTIDTDEKINNDYEVNIYSDELVKSDIENIKNKVDLIIVSIDWSNINTMDITDEEKRIVNYLKDLGVNVIIGNTSYSIQPIEMIDNTLVCYSLGNLLSGHNMIDSRISMMVDFDVTISKDKVSIDDINVSLYYAYNVYGRNYKVIPFVNITNELNRKTYYEKYRELLTTDKNYINMYTIGD